MAITLGLDLGPNSIGWALIEDGKRLVDCGVRVFPEGVDNFDTAKERSRNESRRIARTMRRQIRRRAVRTRKLISALIEAGLFPSDQTEQQKFYALDPYELRTKALDHPLPLHELGRVLLHINQRRGFKSNKREEAKADSKAKRKQSAEEKKPKGGEGEKKTEDMLLEMRELEKAIKISEARTLGEYLYQKAQSLDHAHRVDDDHVRGRHTLRKMLIEEFDQIWSKQAEYHPKELTAKLAYGKLGKGKDIQRPLPKYREFLDTKQTVKNQRYNTSDLDAFGVFGLIFFHRTLKPVPKEIVGLCELEPGARRCSRADRRAQRFRLLQEVNNLRYIDPDAREERELDAGQRAILLEHLAERDTATFDVLRKKLGFLDSIKFNLERGKRSGIKGMVVDWQMAKAIGKKWSELSERTKNDIVDALIRSVDDDETFERLTKEFELDADQANTALAADLPEGYVKLSLVAINKLLPHLERGLVYEHVDPAKSARAQAGYDARWSLQRRIFDKLPDPARVSDCPIGDIPNPVVKRTLVELRKLVNAVLSEQRRATGDSKWKPDFVHVEMGRDVKTRPKNKKSPAYRKYVDEENERAEREEKRDTAKSKLRENNISYGAGGRNIAKYLLWEEQGRTCIYSGKSISFSQLFTEQIEVDHILPYSQSLDDSQMNLVVCFHEENHPTRGKGQRTPREWLESSDPAKYEKVCQRAKSLPYPKYKRFLRKEAKLDDFIARQLNDMRYIAKATGAYMQCLFGLDENKQGAVLGLKGQLTSTLRRIWGLESLLSELPNSPAWQQQANLRPGEKNRADHRHHAIDAIVVALTNKRRLQKLAKGFDVLERVDKETGEVKYETAYLGNDIATPWKGFREDVVAKIKELKVSHRAERKVAGGLHEDTLYGPTEQEGVFVVRKAVEALSPNEVPLIRDAGIRRIIEARLADREMAVGRGKKKKDDKDFAKKWREAMSKLAMPSGVPIKRVRVLRNEQTIQPIREGKPDQAYVKPGSTHHLAIFEWNENGSTKRDAVFVTMLDAINRLKKREPIIQRVPPKDNHTIPPDARFLFSLSRGEAVLAGTDGQEVLLTLQTAISTNHRLIFAKHTDARKSDEIEKIAYSPRDFGELRKVTVDPLGRIRWAND